MSKEMIGKMFRNNHNLREIILEKIWISDTGTVFFVSGMDSFTANDLNKHWTPISKSQEDE
jgi:hypothetical protein|tara:strand:- start:14704 stop:14886 length:183 start_codon:yes stop_codon:yes gene_type:complete